MKTSEVLRLAKRNLEPNRKPPFVLESIGEAIVFVFEPYSDLRRVCAVVDSRIKPFANETTWLYCAVTGGVVDSTYKDRTEEVHDYMVTGAAKWLRAQSPKAIQAWRHAWVDQMIAEFEAKGD